MRFLEATGALPLGHVEILRFAQDDKLLPWGHERGDIPCPKERK
jgi:hypothetical protein